MLRRVELTDPLVAPLLDGLGREYDERYGPGDELGAYDAVEFSPPCGVFVVLEIGGVLAAGGGLRRWAPGVAELKRMWTDPEQRRRGHARAVLEQLEQHARRLGYARVRMETGTAQPEALALYAGAGYDRIVPYGRYSDDPRNVCFEKAFVPRAARKR